MSEKEKIGKLETKFGLRERFLTKVRKTDGCWLWVGSKNAQGYGHIGEGGHKSKIIRAHRVAYGLFVGPIPEGKQVLHRCDNPSCVNPSHLWIGTNADNIADCVAKGRMPHGEGNVHAKLTWQQVQEIRERYRRWSRQFSARALGRQYGVTHTNILSIVKEESWKASDAEDVRKHE